MKRSLIPCIACFSCCILIVAPVNITRSCGPSFAADETRFALFKTGIDYQRMEAFDYSEALLNFRSGDSVLYDYETNCKEWVAYCGNGVKQADIYEVQYKMAPDAFLGLYNKPQAISKHRNRFLQWLFLKENKQALDYMALAKEAESTQPMPAEADPWDTAATPLLKDCAAIAARAADRIRPATAAFLRERYAFQAVKMYYYAGGADNHYSKLHRLFAQHLKKSTSVVAGWSLVYEGMVQSDVNDKTACLLRAFDQTEEKKKFAYLQISRDDLLALKKVVKDPYMMMLANTMGALKNKGKALAAIEAVCRFAPNSKYVPLLITREINKLEDWLWSPEMLGFSNGRPDYESDKQKQQRADKAYLNKVTHFVETIYRTDKQHRAFLQLALAHLYNMQGQYVQTLHLLKQDNATANPTHATQRLIERVIATAHTADISTGGAKQQLAGYFAQLMALNPLYKKQLAGTSDYDWDNLATNEQEDDVSELFVLLSHCYERKGDRVTAGLLSLKSKVAQNRYSSSCAADGTGYGYISYFDACDDAALLDGVLAWKHKRNKTAFERLLSPAVWGLDDMYKDVKGTILFRQNKHAEALRVFESMSPDFWEKHYEYATYLPLRSVAHLGSLNPAETAKPALYKRHSKLLILQEMVQLEAAFANAATPRRKAALAYQLGNAAYSTSHDGKAWMMFNYGQSAGENVGNRGDNYDWAYFGFHPNNIKYKAVYYESSRAVGWYKKALAYSTDAELSAKCLLALSLCEKKVQYLGQLRSKYWQTAAYAAARGTCPDVK